MKKDTSWGKVADWYQGYLSDKDSYHSQVVAPNLLRVMEIKPREKVLDLACGTGFFSELFHAQGAEVVGVDIGKELIALAQKNASKDITFIVSAAHTLTGVEDNSIDKIACVLAIQNINEVQETIAECKRVLKPKGKVFLVMNHPAFRIPGNSAWQWDEAQKKQYRRIDAYLSEKAVEIVMHPGSKPDEKTISFHWSLQYYVKLARTHGFVISRLEEWISHKSSEKGPRQQEEDRMRKEIPLFLLLELTQQEGYN